MEQAPDLAVQTSIMSDDELVVFMSRYSEEHRDSVARSFIMEVTVFERQREEIYAAAQRQFEAMSVSEKARHYAEVAKDATVGYVSEFADDPLGHSADLAVGAAYFAGDLAVPGGLDAPTRFIRGESTFAQAVADQSVSAGVEMAAGFAMGKVFRVGKRLGSALVKGEKTLAKAVVERIARKTEFVTREKRWMQLASEGKLSKQIMETIRRTGGRRVYDRHGLELAHRPGKPAAQGHDYRDALPKLKPIHRNQHRFYDEKPGGKIELRVTPHGKNRMTEPGVNGFKKLCEIETEVVRKKK